MLSDSFFDAARDRITKIDLTPDEKDDLDQLGRRLGIGHYFSKTFTVMIENSRWCFDGSWPVGNDNRRHHSTIECSLYTPAEEGGFDRAPKVTFAYWAENPDGGRDMILDVDFMPAHIVGNTNTADMVPHIKSCPGLNGPDMPYDDIACYQTRNVIRLLKGEELKGVPTVSLLNTVIQPNRYPS